MIVVTVSGMLSAYYYYEVYQLQLNGKVEHIRLDIKKAMYITVRTKEHNLGHFWPKLQRNIEVGDSVMKNPQDSVIVLIKKKSKLRLSCEFEEAIN
jgi:L-lysine 2,3-aminomutase